MTDMLHRIEIESQMPGRIKVLPGMVLWNIHIGLYLNSYFANRTRFNRRPLCGLL